MDKKSILFFFSGILICSFSAKKTPKLNQKIPKPNLIFIFSDQQSFDMLGCYGNNQIKTPNLDRFASQGILFTHCFSNEPICTPFRGMLMSEFYQEKGPDYRTVIDSFSSGRYMSEHATAGVPPERVLMKFMTRDDLYTSEMLEYHTKDNPYHKGGLTLFRKVEQDAKNLYGDPGEDQERRIRQMGYLQYEEIRLAMESSQRRKFYTSGIQFWMFNDCWPASGWSLIDYWGCRKAAWYAMASGCKPVIAASETTKNSVKWWITSDLFSDVKVNVVVKIQPVSGKAIWEKQISVKVPGNHSVLAMELPLIEMKKMLGNHAVLVCEITYNNGHDRSYWTPGLPQDVVYPKTNLKIVSQKQNSEGGEITISTDNWARVVTLDTGADADFEDNYFEMLPGETRTIHWQLHPH